MNDNGNMPIIPPLEQVDTIDTITVTHCFYDVVRKSRDLIKHRNQNDKNYPELHQSLHL